MPSKNRKYRDLDLNFTPHPVTGDIGVVTDEIAIKRALKNLVLTGLWERPYRPELDSPVRNFLFENITPVTKHRLREDLKALIVNHEPRVDLHDINISEYPDNNKIVINITFSMLNQIEPVTVNIFLKRTR